MPDIVIIGDVNVDVNFSIPAYPMPGNEAIATTVQMHTGGSSVNTAIALSKMDMDVGFIGRIGQDTLAKQVLSDLTSAGVDCTHIQVDPKVSTGLIFIAVTADGERTMFAARGANAFTDPTAIDPAYFSDCRWIHLSGYSFLSYSHYQTVLTALDLAQNSPHTRVSLDTGTEPALRARSQIIEVLPRIDIIFPNEAELALLSGGLAPYEALDYLMSKGANAIVNKRGANSTILAVGDKRTHLPAFDINVKDTTGAGDSFNAGVVLGRLIGLSWEASTALGNALGGLATTHEGSGANLIQRNRVAKLIETHLFRDEWQTSQAALEELTAYFEGNL
ncbi:MAG: carbohydrate kinase family protein [Chloroflexota bacterium]